MNENEEHPLYFMDKEGIKIISCSKCEKQQTKVSQMRKTLAIAESALKSCKTHEPHDYFSYYDEDLVKCALSLIASIRNDQETK